MTAEIAFCRLFAAFATEKPRLNPCLHEILYEQTEPSRGFVVEVRTQQILSALLLDVSFAPAGKRNRRQRLQIPFLILTAVRLPLRDAATWLS